MEPTYRKSWDGNLLLCSDLTLDPSFKVRQGLSNLKVINNYLIIGTTGLQCQANLWAGNLLMWSDLTFSPSFKTRHG